MAGLRPRWRAKHATDGLDGPEAARIAKRYRADLPVVLVTNKHTDDAAAEAFQAGIADYVLQDRLARLPAAASRSPGEAPWSRQRQRIEADREVLIRIMESTDAGVIGSRIDGTVIAWNPAAQRCFGCARNDAIGRTVRAVLGPTYTEALDAAVHRAGHDGVAQTLEQALLCGDGSGTLSLSVSPIRDAADEITGISIIARDVTEQRRIRLQLQQARDQADQANQAKSRFLALITHELRTPLHGLLGYGELMLLEDKLRPAQGQYLESMMTAGQYLLGTINAVLDMSQIEAERLELVPVAIDLAELVQTCLDVVRPRAAAKRLTLIVIPVTPLQLVADATRLRQVLLNLLGNAIKFTAAGRVEVRCRWLEESNRARFEVADTGPGVRSMHHDKLFQPFERLNAASVSGIEGSGLGLALTAKLVQLMGGQIGYQDNPGGGALFWFELPCRDVAATTSEIEQILPAVPATAPLRVLVVDDDVLNRTIAARFLTLAGHAVTCADSGVAAVQSAAGHAFDVILMDVRMPGMNGLEATRQIRMLPRPYGDVPVVAVTAHAFAEQVRTCLQAGMNGHIAKPFKQARLLAAVAEAAAGRSGQQLPAAAVRQAAPSEVAVFDRGMFAEIEGLLPRADLAKNLTSLIARSTALLDRLDSAELRSPAPDLAEAAHRLAGGAGTLGFSAMANAARQFERAADAGTAELGEPAQQLAGAIAAALIIARARLKTITAEPV